MFHFRTGKMPGSYILLLELHEPQQIAVGRLGGMHFVEGFYAYAGSALNGLEARIKRHIRMNKKHYWHIDYLRERADIYEIVLIPGEQRLECALARALNEELTCIRRFGSSDCHCPGHLFYAADKNKLDALAHIAVTRSGVTLLAFG